MATTVKNYQCPTCTGPLNFVGQSGKLECDYCGGFFEVVEIEALYATTEATASQESEQPWQKDAEAAGWSEDEMKALSAFICPSCAAEIICDTETAATSCAYCGNPTILPGRLSGAMKPDMLIPFKLDKKAAIAELKKYYKGKLFLPSNFASDSVLEEIKGIYVPFWLFDCNSDGSVNFNATRSTTYTSGDYQVTKTDHFNVFRAGTLTFSKVPVDASTKMPDTHMDAIEPFDYGALQPFSSAYLPGFIADKYDLTFDACAPRADVRMEQTTVVALQGTVTGYSTVIERDKRISLKRGSVHYALLPVWMFKAKWKDEAFIFAVNGQTGKLAGNLPISKMKFLLWTLVFSLPIALVAALINFLLF